MRYAIDAGHGGRDSGAIGAAGTLEKNYALAQALVFASLATDAGHEVVLTREVDTSVGLRERVDTANHADADCFVSWHWNASVSPDPHGTIVMCHKDSVAGTQLAQAMLREIAPLTRPEPTIPTRWERVWSVPDGVPGSAWERSAPTVIARTKMPAVLVEVDFGSNPDAEKRMSNDDADFLIAVAKAALRALDAWEEQRVG